MGVVRSLAEIRIHFFLLREGGVFFGWLVGWSDG